MILKLILSKHKYILLQCNTSIETFYHIQNSFTPVNYSDFVCLEPGGFFVMMKHLRDAVEFVKVPKNLVQLMQLTKHHRPWQPARNHSPCVFRTLSENYTFSFGSW